MPTNEKILGFANRWYVPAIRSAQQIVITDYHVQVVTPVYFLATKLEAFHGRGHGDVLASHDLEDIITLIDGRSELAAEIGASAADVRQYVTSEIHNLLNDKVFVDALGGFLLPDPASQSRRSLLEGKLRVIAGMAA